jgi:hypothetical protein
MVSGRPLVRIINNNKLVLQSTWHIEAMQEMMTSEMNKSKRQIFRRIAIADWKY